MDNNSYGQLGIGSRVSTHEPRDVAGLTNVTDLIAGNMHACALSGDGSLRCWGLDRSASAGATIVTSPKDVAGLSAIKTLTVGKMHRCAQSTDGTVKCWGVNSAGATGESGPTITPTPKASAAFDEAESIMAGDWSTRMIRAGGTVR